MTERPRPRTRLPDRGRIDTEQRNPRSARLHELDAAGIVRLMQREDRAVLRALASARGALTRFIRAAAERFDAAAAEGEPGRLVYIGAGTSGRLGVLDASEAPPTFAVSPGRIVGVIAGGEGALRRSSEGREDEPDGAAAEFDAIGLDPRDTVLGIAAGGTTPYVIGGLRLAARRGCLTALLTCARVRRPAWVRHLIVLPTGPEVLTGSTRLKAGTATKMALNTISTALMVLSGRVHGNLMVDLRATNDKLRDRAARIIAAECRLTRAASLRLLDRAEGSVKAALVMHHAGVDLAEARARLALARGRVADALRE